MLKGNRVKQGVSLFLLLSMLLTMLPATAWAREAEGLVWWTDDPLVQTLQTAAQPANAKKEIKMFSAQNEYEDYQIVLNSPAEDFTITGVSFTDLVSGENVIGKDNLSYMFALYEIAEPIVTGFDEGGEFAGGIEPGVAVLQYYPKNAKPDPLSNQRTIEVKKGLNQPVYISAFVGSDTAAGNYQGMVTVHTTKGNVRVPLTLEVFDTKVTELKDSGFTVSNWFFDLGQSRVREWNVYKNAYGVKEDHTPEEYEILSNWVEFLAAHRQNAATISPVFFLDDANTTCDKDGNFTFDWSLFDKALDIYLQNGLTTVIGMHAGYANGFYDYRLVRDPNADDDSTIPGVNLYPQAHDNYLERNGYQDAEGWYEQYYTELARHLEEFDITGYPQFAGTDKKTAFDIWLQHLTDECTNDSYYRALLNLFREYFVIKDEGGNVLKEGRNLDSDHGVLIGSDLKDRCDILVPQLDVYNMRRNQYQERMQGTGMNEVWAYICMNPGGSYMNRFVRQPGTVYPLLFWYYANEGLTGYLQYSLNGWPLGWWRDGDTYIVYPDVENKTFMSSIRFEGQRDGLEDYELFQVAMAKNPEKTQALLDSTAKYPDKGYVTNADSFRKLRYALLELAANGDTAADFSEIVSGDDSVPDLPLGAHYVDNTDENIAYGGTFEEYVKGSADGKCYNGSVHVGSAEGDTIEYTFTGIGIGVMVEKNIGVGGATFELYNESNELIDTAEADCTAPVGVPFFIAYDKQGLTNGTYKIKVINKTANGKSAMLFDAFVVQTAASGEGDYVSVNVGSYSEGSLSVSDSFPAKGTDVAVMVSPNAGYYLRTLFVNGAPVEAKNGKYTIANIQENTEVTAAFAPDTSTNVALNKPVAETAGQTQLGGNVPARFTDGNIDTGYANDGGDGSGGIKAADLALEVDLNGRYTLTRAVLHAMHDANNTLFRMPTYQFQYKDGDGEWTTAYTMGDQWTARADDARYGYEQFAFEQPMHATHVRIFIPKSAEYTQWGGVELRELELYGYDETHEPNIALNKAVAETGGQTTAGEFVPANITDGKITTSYANVGDGTTGIKTANLALEIDLNGRYVLSGAKLDAMYSDDELYRLPTYEFQYKVGDGAWTTAYTMDPSTWEKRGDTMNGSQRIALDTPVEATHVRIYIPANASYTQWGGVQINELEVYGVSKGITKDELRAVVEEAEAKDQALYTVESYQAMERALNEAKVCLYDKVATPEEMLAAKDALALAMSGLAERSQDIQFQSDDINANGYANKESVTITVTGATAASYKREEDAAYTDVVLTDGKLVLQALTDGKYIVKATGDGIQNDMQFSVDASAPVVEGIAPDATAYGKVPVRVSDANLAGVELDGRIIRFTKGVAEFVVESDGAHTVKATDIAGNETVCGFEILKRDELNLWLHEARSIEQGAAPATDWEAFQAAMQAAEAALTGTPTAEEYRSAEAALLDTGLAVIKANLADLLAKAKEKEKQTTVYTEASLQVLRSAIGQAEADMPTLDHMLDAKQSYKQLKNAVDGLEKLQAYSIRVEGGKSSAERATANTEITITAEVPEGMKFAGWTSENRVVFADASAEQTTFAMLDEDVVIRANYMEKDTYILKALNDKIQAESVFSAGSRLVVTQLSNLNGKHPDMAAALAGKDVLGLYDIQLVGTARGNIKVTFDVGAEHNGKTVVIVHQKSEGADASVEVFSQIVTDGKVSCVVDGFSPFALGVKKEVTPGGDGGQAGDGGQTGNGGQIGVPQTGDSFVGYSVATVMMCAFLIGAVLIVYFKKKKN